MVEETVRSLRIAPEAELIWMNFIWMMPGRRDL